MKKIIWNYTLIQIKSNSDTVLYGLYISGLNAQDQFEIILCVSFMQGFLIFAIFLTFINLTKDLYVLENATIDPKAYLKRL